MCLQRRIYMCTSNTREKRQRPKRHEYVLVASVLNILKVTHYTYVPIRSTPYFYYFYYYFITIYLFVIIIIIILFLS